MNTPAHLLLAGAAFGKKHDRSLVWAAMAGALLPDLSLYLMAGISLFVLQIPPQVVFDELYFSDAWQAVFKVDNSFLVWGFLLGAAHWWRKPWAVALTAGALLHLALDFPLHHDDGRAHFWPVSNWVFESPYSYWDSRHGANIVAPIEYVLALGAAGVMYWRRPGGVIALLTTILVLLETLSVSSWLFYLVVG